MTRPVVWLASFPKSGSTWLRFLLHHVLHGPPATSGHLDRYLPSLHGQREPPAAAVARGGVVLSHKAAGPHLERWGPGVGVIHLVRHPVDVLLSDTRFFVMTQLGGYLRNQGRGPDSVTPADVDALASMFLTAVLQGQPTPQRRELGVGLWNTHTSSWLAHSGPCIRVRYEDLRADTEGQLTRVLSWLGIEVPADRVAAAVAGCDVVAMRAMQEREIRQRIPGRFYDPAHAAGYRAGLRFVGPAPVGDVVRLPAAVRAQLAQAWKCENDVLGYRLDESQDAVRPPGPEVGAQRPLIDPEGVGAALADPHR